MKAIQWNKLNFIILITILLAACSTGHKKTNTAVVDQSNAAYAEAAQPTGMGEESGFGEQGGVPEENNVAAKRVYHFPFDSDTVQEEDKPAIIANANTMIAHPDTKIILEGHTDPRGSREYNIGLGERRGKSVAALLTAKGVNPSQIRMVSYGSEKPAIVGHNETAFAEDRRVVLENM